MWSIYRLKDRLQHMHTYSGYGFQFFNQGLNGWSAPWKVFDLFCFCIFFCFFFFFLPSCVSKQEGAWWMACPYLSRQSKTDTWWGELELSWGKRKQTSEKQMHILRKHERTGEHKRYLFCYKVGQLFEAHMPPDQTGIKVVWWTIGAKSGAVFYTN